MTEPSQASSSAPTTASAETTGTTPDTPGAPIPPAAPTPRLQLDTGVVLFLISFSAILGLNQALVKFVNDGMAPLFQAGMRSLCALLLIGAYAFVRSTIRSRTTGTTDQAFHFRRDTLLLGILNGLLFSGEFALLFQALELTSVSRVSLFFYTMPVMVAGVAHFLLPNEQLTRARIIGLLLAFGGVALALALRPDAGAPAYWLGDVLALLAAACWAGITLLTRATRLNTIAPEQNLIYQLVVSGVLLTVLAWLLGDTVRTMTGTIAAMFAFQVVVVAGFGFLIWLWVLGRYPVARMASFSLLAPLFGIASGWLLFDEPLSFGFMVACAMVASGLLLINRPDARPSSDQTEEGGT